MKRQNMSSGKAGKTILGVICTIVAIFILIGKISKIQRNNDPSPAIPATAILPAKGTKQIQFTEIFYQIATTTAKQVGNPAISLISLTTNKKTHDRWPYEGFCSNLLKYRHEAKKILEIENRSDYDAVVFVQSSDSIYSALLKKRSSLRANVSSDDRISFYVGNKWSEQFEFQINPFCLSCSDERRPVCDTVNVRGIFTKVDSTTLQFIKHEYHFTCMKSDTLVGMLTSTNRGKLEFIGKSCPQLNEIEYNHFLLEVARGSLAQKNANKER